MKACLAKQGLRDGAGGAGRHLVPQHLRGAGWGGWGKGERGWGGWVPLPLYPSISCA